MALSLQIGNFEDKGKQVPYLVSNDSFPGGKYLKGGKYGVSPNLIIAILNDVGVGDCELREVAQMAIDQAETFNNPPPPVAAKPSVKYWLYVRNSQAQGPYTIDQLEQLATADSLVCRVGAKDWVKASTIMEFASEDLPPPPPCDDDDEPEYEDEDSDAIAEQIKNQLVSK